MRGRAATAVTAAAAVTATAIDGPIFRTTGLGTSLAVISEDYGGSGKSSGTVTHQTLPGFSQPFCGRPSFRGYSPSYPTQQSGAGVGATTVEPSSWSYGSPSNDTLATQYAAPSRRQPVNPSSTPTQHQLTATASLTASKSFLFFSFLFFLPLSPLSLLSFFLSFFILLVSAVFSPLRFLLLPLFFSRVLF